MGDNNSNVPWYWSTEHNDHYYITYDANGNAIFNFSKKLQNTTQYSSQSASAQTATYAEDPTKRIERADSGTGGSASKFPYTTSYHASQYDPNIPPSVPEEYRAQSNFIPGTPERGWCERLDSSYRMRTGSEAHHFFKKGRVFSMLYTEAASENLARCGTENDSVTVVRFGEAVFSQIRRFVVVSVKRNFVYACGISTYSGRATTRIGCNPAEHAIAYFSGTDPRYCYVANEYGNGMSKEPIQIDAADSSLTMLPASRIRFGKTYAIEWNVKVKDIGRVIPEHMTKLLTYWKEENDEEDQY